MNVSAAASSPPPRPALQASNPGSKTLPAAALAAPTDWRDQVIYFPLTDRFSDGNPHNNDNVDLGNPLRFHGGDLQGIRNKLDYIKGSGATALWLAPLNENTGLGTIGTYQSAGYHGYWIKNHENVEPHQGTLEDAQGLVRDAANQNMPVLLDVVLNHVGPDHPWLQDPDKKEWFHNHGGIRDFNDQKEVELGDLGGLPDLNQENPEVYEYLLNNTVGWLEKTGAAGVRLDAIKHVSKDFWGRFTHDLKERSGNPDLMVLGEVLHGDVNYVAPYQKAGIDYLFDVPMYYSMRDVFGNDGSCAELARRFGEDVKYADSSKLVTLLDNHDFPRFMHTAKGSDDEKVKRLELGLDCLMTMRGIPSIYYGTEAAMDGGEDPDNRRDMQFGQHPEVRDHLKQLSDIRAAHEPLRRGQQLEMWVDPTVYAFARRTDKDEAITVLNNAHEARSLELPLRDGSPLREGETLKDALTGREFKVENGKINVSMEAKKALILVRG